MIADRPDLNRADLGDLVARLEAMAPPAEAEELLRSLAFALFPGSPPDARSLTWPERAGDRPPLAGDGETRTEARLRAAEARYRTLVEQIPAVTFMAALGEGGNEIYVSPHIEALLGFTQRQWLENPFLWYTQLHPDDRAIWNEEFARGCRTGGPFEAECRFLARDGRVVWVRGEARLVRDELGRPLFLQGVAFDITEAKRAQELLVREAVHATEERYRALVQGIGAVFWEAEPTPEPFRFAFVSRRAEEILGFPTRRLVQEPGFWLTRIHPEDRERVTAEWRSAVGAGQDHELEYRVIAADGRVLWLLDRLSVVLGGESRPPQLLGVMFDVTERRAAEEERARLLSREREARAEAEVLNQLGRQLAGELDVSRLVQAVIDAGRELIGAAYGAFFYNVSEGGGESYMLYALSGAPPERFAGFTLPRNTPLFEVTFRGQGPLRLDDVRRDPRFGRNAPFRGMPPGHLPVVSYLAVPVVSRSGEVLGGLFFGHPEARRFSERHERVISGLAGHAAIAIDNAQLYQAAEAARRAAEEANRGKDDFLAFLSHELRTPLTAIVGWVRLARHRMLDAAGTERAMDVIDRNARLLGQLINDILDVSRIVAGKLELDLQPIEALGSVILPVAESVRPDAEAKGIRLEVAVAPITGPVGGDPQRLQQVVWNLLSNAVKFTAGGGRIDVRCERAGSFVEMTVRDTGQGIAPDFLPRIFERFSQAPQPRRSPHGGLGLGLAIVRHLVELHGGQIAAASDGLGRGATFTVRLPLTGDIVVAAPTWRSAPAPTPESLEGRSVLVVEDEEDTRNLLLTILGQAGAVTRSAATAREALDVLATWTPEVLVSDVGLPDESGYALIRRLRALPPARGGDIPAVALTAFASVGDRDQTLQAGFQLHLPKPVDPGELVAAVARLAARAEGT